MQDAFQSSLDKGAGSQDPLTQLHQPISDLKAPQQTHYLAFLKHLHCGDPCSANSFYQVFNLWRSDGA